MYSNDCNNYKKTPRTLQESKFGPYTELYKVKKSYKIYYIIPLVILPILLFLV